MDLYEELRGLVDIFNAEGIAYALCGGLAVAFHGYPRYTKDIDFLVRPEDMDRVQTVVARLGHDLPPARLPFDIGTARERRIVRISKIEPGQVMTLEFLLVTAVYEEVWLGQQVFEWEGRQIRVASAAGLVLMKRLAGRPQDLLDIQQLGFEP